jgi:hypothetical protein
VAPRSEAAKGTHGVHIPHAQVDEVLRGLQARVGSGQSAGADLGGWGSSEGQKSRLPQTQLLRTVRLHRKNEFVHQAQVEWKEV